MARRGAPKYRSVTKRLAKEYRCEATPEAVEKHLVERARLKPKDLLRVTNAMRKVIQEFVDEDVVRINKKYKTKVIETPSFLTGMLPTGAASFFDTFTKKPFQLYFLTTDPKRDPPKSVSQLIDLLVHEEYGHCVNHSNSVLHFGGRPSKLELLPDPPTGARDRGPVVQQGEGVPRGLAEARGQGVADQGGEGLRQAPRKVRRAAAHQRRARVPDEEVEAHQVPEGDRRRPDQHGQAGPLRVHRLGPRTHAASRGATSTTSSSQRTRGCSPGTPPPTRSWARRSTPIEDTITDDKARVKFSTYLTGIGFPPRSIYRKMLRGLRGRLVGYEKTIQTRPKVRHRSTNVSTPLGRLKYHPSTRPSEGSASVPKQITTFEEFIRHILKLVLWVVLLTPLFILPIYYVFYTLFGTSFVDFFSLSTKPEQLMAFIDAADDRPSRPRASSSSRPSRASRLQRIFCERLHDMGGEEVHRQDPAQGRPAVCRKVRGHPAELRRPLQAPLQGDAHPGRGGQGGLPLDPPRPDVHRGLAAGARAPRPDDLHRRPFHRGDLRLRDNQLHPARRDARRMGEQQQVLAPRVPEGAPPDGGLRDPDDPLRASGSSSSPGRSTWSRSSTRRAASGSSSSSLSGRSSSSSASSPSSRGSRSTSQRRTPSSSPAGRPSTEG